MTSQMRQAVQNHRRRNKEFNEHALVSQLECWKIDTETETRHSRIQIAGDRASVRSAGLFLSSFLSTSRLCDRCDEIAPQYSSISNPTTDQLLRLAARFNKT